MTNKQPKTVKEKTELLEKTLVEVWEALSPGLKEQRHLKEIFLSIQIRGRKLNHFFKKGDQHAQTSK